MEPNARVPQGSRLPGCGKQLKSYPQYYPGLPSLPRPDPQFFWLNKRRRPSFSTPEWPSIGIHHALSRKHFLNLQSDFSHPDKTIRIANATFSQKLSSSGLTSTSCRTPNFSFKSICRIETTYLPHPGNSPVKVIIHSLDYKDHITNSSISPHL